jgi:hypothetical protein
MVGEEEPFILLSVWLLPSYSLACRLMLIISP